ncbi:methyltransferase domain-containing protein [Streptomyces microflavus]|uniref:methyltransferase domain-containing protein n=1 Tax=Streptomyces microflavus TaxID=1919 RepID=UPI0037CE23B3
MTEPAQQPSPASERYGERIFSHLSPEETDRLDALAQALDPRTFRRFEQLPMRDNWHCLEIGAGLGTTAHWLAARCTAGRVVATDIDTRLFPTADARNGWQGLEHDVTQDDFPEGSFDLIHLRWVLSHLRGRDEVLPRVVRWLAPGGWLLVEDLARFPLESSPNPLYRKVSLAMCDAAAERIGTDFFWARNLSAPLRAAGLVHVDMEASAESVGPGPMGRFWQLTAEQLASDLHRTSDVTPCDLDRFLAEIRSEEFSDLCLGTVAAWGQRSEGVGPKTAPAR